MAESIDHKDKESVLQQLAASNTFDTDWPTLRSYFESSLEDALKLFLDKGPTRPYRPPGASPPEPVSQGSVARTETSSPASEHSKPPSDSLLLSPSQSTSIIEPVYEENLQPSTPGGLVVPPFPPIDRSRRRGPSPLMGVRTNGIPNQRIAGSALEALDDRSWEEETAIGGRKLVGWLDEEKGRKEVDRIRALLGEMEEPPFTIQRLAELFLHPTSQHSSLGKFIRAIEKSLLVTTPWEAPSYDYVPPTTFPEHVGGSSSLSSYSSPASNSSSSFDADTTVPPGSTTPLFSPIPFLVRPSSDPAAASTSENGQLATASNESTEGLMSPLLISEEKANFSARSPTPEPEDSNAEAIRKSDEAVDLDTEMTPLSPEPADIPRPSAPGPLNDPTSPIAPSVDPGNTSYLGRVDELDTGPIPTDSLEDAGVKRRASNASSVKAEVEAELDRGNMVGGQGEGGNLAPHGMSEKPVPLSSTTVVPEEGAASGVEGRAIKGLRRSESERDLRERFVSGGVQESEGGDVDDGAKEDDGETSEAK
ncbi:hypothetical protein L202_01474 [Cryptococcus amylolentus CBS 6039]|uniref:Uncharacterized protein n=1 Tax=Cryptococcus amylolentus CBS 6039 TaxID=1295533 RepID=A0A1E3I465_9TREE|nr:hypothetical protein L202_01474 [Cryptococcus amylolentus CBS 6039]ODN83307.1 hypothetical protein L202_01474 [Cryptococcus amylolentus CBS 6039]